jgi:vancomycin resistance protein VanJ
VFERKIWNHFCCKRCISGFKKRLNDASGIEARRAAWRKAGSACFIFSTAIWLGTTICFIGCWDQVAAITLFPYWCWALLGCVVAYPSLRIRRERWLWLLPVFWVITSLFYSENLVPLLRLMVRDPAPVNNRPSGVVRVVTLNCAGNPAAATEVGSFKPDIVLLQEIPSTNHLARLSREWFGASGSFVAGLDCAILARGSMSDEKTPIPQYSRTVVRMHNGLMLAVTSLRLVPPVGRFDLWNPSAWRASADNRRLRRFQLQDVLQDELKGSTLPEVLGGDFNTPVPDAVFGLMGQFHDAYRESGRGWGNTALNSLPIARPDQIWIKGFHSVSTRAIQTQTSDHRLVLTDIEILPKLGAN